MGVHFFTDLPKPLGSLVVDYCYADQQLSTQELVIRKLISSKNATYVSLDFDFEKIEKIFFEVVDNLIPMIRYFKNLDFQVSHVDNLRKFACTRFVYKEKEIETLDPIFQLHLVKRVQEDAAYGHNNPTVRGQDYYKRMMKMEEHFKVLDIRFSQNPPEKPLASCDVRSVVETRLDECPTSDFHGSLLPFLMIP